MASAGERNITEQGFQFLLLDTYGQLWLLLREYIASAGARFGARAHRSGTHRPYATPPRQALGSLGCCCTICASRREHVCGRAPLCSLPTLAPAC